MSVIGGGIGDVSMTWTEIGETCN